MKVMHLNLGVPFAVRTNFTAVAPSATTASAARAAQQRAKLEELRAYMAIEGAWESPQPSRRAAPTAAPGAGARVFKSSQPVASQPASLTIPEMVARAEELGKVIQARKFAASMEKVRERYRNSGTQAGGTSGKVTHG